MRSITHLLLPFRKLLRFSTLAAFAALPSAPLSANMQLGQNLDSITYYSTAPAFANCMKMASSWATIQDGNPSNDTGYASHIPLRSDGYPQVVPFSTPIGQQRVLAYAPIYENGTHRIRANGTGTIVVDGPGFFNQTIQVNGSVTVDAVISGAHNLADPHWDQTVPALRQEPSLFTIKILTSSSSDPIRNISIMRPGYLSASVHAFDADLLSHLNGVSVIRFMDWQATNNSPRTAFNINANSRDYYTQSTNDGVAADYLFDLAAAVNADLWLCVPHMMTDQGIHDMAIHAANRLPAGRKLYIEYTNEHWNGMFTAHNYIASQPWAGNNLDKKYGTRAKQIFDIFTQRFNAAGKGSQLRRVLANQAANVSRMADSLSTAETSTDLLAIAPYFGTVYTSAPNPLPSFTALASDTHTKFPEVRSWLNSYKNLSQQTGKPLICYEGGQHYVGAFGQENNHPLTQQLVSFNRQPVMAQLYTTYLNDLHNAGVTLFCNFSLAGRFSKSGSWGTKEFWAQNIGPNQGQALKLWAVLNFINNPPSGGGGGGSGGGSTSLPQVGDTIALRAAVNNNYVSADNSGQSPLIANKTSVGNSEKFTVLDAGSGWIGLRSHANNLFVVAENAGAASLIANRTAIGAWERFRFVDAGNNQVALQAQINNNYVRAASATQPLIASATTIGSQERFTWQLDTGGGSGGGGGGASNGLALNKPATASSNEPGNTPDKANDGSNATRWAASSGSMPQWWQVDLGQASTITALELVFEGPSKWKYRVEARATTTDAWTTLTDQTGNNNTAQTYNHSIGTAGSNKRYVRVTVTGYDGGFYWASLWDVKVIGTTGSSGGGGGGGGGGGNGHPGAGLGTGTITRDVWNNIFGTAIADIPLATTPSSTGTLNSFEVPTNVADNYGQRVEGFLHPSTSGSYTFWIAGDDSVELWLSTNDNPSNATRIAHHSGWTNPREWAKYPSQKSAPINLTAGQKYHIRALMKEGGGGDSLAVSWRLNSTNPATNDGTFIIPGSALSPRASGSGGGGGSAQPVSLETYDPPAAKSPPTHRLFSEGTASGGSCAVLESTATGQFVTYAIPNVAAGTYTIYIRHKRATNRAIFQVATADTLGGSYTNRGSPIDAYSGSFDYVEVPAGTVTFSSAGTKFVRFTTTGKNASSSSFWMAIDRVRLQP